MTGVQNIEAAVGECDLPAGLAVGRQLRQELFERAQLARGTSLCFQQIQVDSFDRNRLDAEAFDFKPGGRVGHLDRGRPVGAVGPRCGQHRQHHVTGARHIVDAPPFRAQPLCGLLVAVRLTMQKKSAVLIEGDHDRLGQFQTVQQTAGGHLQRVGDIFTAHRVQAGGGARFGAVRRDAGGAAISLVIVDRSRIDQHRNLTVAGRADQLLTHDRAQHAFVVIFDADNVDAVQQPLGGLHELSCHGLRRRVGPFVIGAEHFLGMTLLGQADERLLDRRRPAVTGEQSARVSSKLIDRLAKLTAPVVIAEQSDADHLTSKRAH